MVPGYINVNLKALQRLPSKPRLERGLRMTCDACWGRIEDERFLVGFVEGKRNMLFHEACVSENDKKLYMVGPSDTAEGTGATSPR